jgi:hypothetical protein
MRNNKSLIPEKAMIPLGLVILCGTFLVSHDWIKMPDWLVGFFMGLGIALEIMGIIKLLNRPKTSV